MPASAVGNYIQDKGYNAAAALTKFRAVKFSALETVTPVTAITDVVVGVVQHDVTAGEITKGKGASCRVEGDTVMEAGGAITVGQRVCIDSSGRAVALTAGNRIIGFARTAASGSGQFCTVHLDLNGDVAGTA